MVGITGLGPGLHGPGSIEGESMSGSDRGWSWSRSAVQFSSSDETTSPSDTRFADIAQSGCVNSDIPPDFVYRFQITPGQRSPVHTPDSESRGTALGDEVRTPASLIH
jgi:hypothetical protein